VAKSPSQVKVKAIRVKAPSNEGAHGERSKAPCIYYFDTRVEMTKFTFRSHESLMKQLITLLTELSRLISHKTNANKTLWVNNFVLSRL